MIEERYDREHDAIIVVLKGKVSVAEFSRGIADLEKLVKDRAPGFRFVADLASIESMEIGVEDQVKTAMSMLDSNGVGTVLRVLPDPESDFAFKALSRSFYSDKVNRRSFRSIEQALAQLGPANCQEPQ